MSAHAQWDEGHTMAGWTGCVLAVVGSGVVGAGLVGWRPVGLWLGLGLLVAAPVVTWLLHLAGWGKPSGVRPREQWGMRVRDLSARQGHPDCLGCRLAGRRPVAVGRVGVDRARTDRVGTGLAGVGPVGAGPADVGPAGAARAADASVSPGIGESETAPPGVATSDAASPVGALLGVAGPDVAPPDAVPAGTESAGTAPADGTESGRDRPAPAATPDSAPSAPGRQDGRTA